MHYTLITTRREFEKIRISYPGNWFEYFKNIVGIGPMAFRGSAIQVKLDNCYTAFILDAYMYILNVKNEMAYNKSIYKLTT